jgi:hypothetical protein
MVAHTARQALAIFSMLVVLIVPAQALAAKVTAEQVAAAVLASPTANAQLKGYSSAIGSLAMFESGGRLDVYNGSCCSGVLQMNGTNIASIRPKVTPAVFRTWPLQQQVNAWATIMSEAITYNAPKQLAAMNSFDGRSITGSMVLACVQLGAGNCNKMIMSGRCTGFADINGTTICKMADKIDGTTTPTGPGTPPVGSGGGGTGIPSPTAVTTPLSTATVLGSCITDGYGGCLSITAAMEQGFVEGSGHSMADVRSMIQMLTVGIVFLISAWLASGLWREYATGRTESVELIEGMRNVLLIVGLIVVMLTVV